MRPALLLSAALAVAPLCGASMPPLEVRGWPGAAPRLAPGAAGVRLAPDTAGVRLAAYDAAAYNALGDYKDVRARALDDAYIAQLGSIFMAHAGANDTFGLCLLHNHFHVRTAPAELMVETVSGNVSRTLPIALPFQQPGDHGLWPSMLGLTAGGGLRPFEFLDVQRSDFVAFADATRRTIRAFYDNPEAHAPFLRALGAKLAADAQLDMCVGCCSGAGWWRRRRRW